MQPNQIDVIKRLGELSRMLDTATSDMLQLDEAAVTAKQSHEVAFAKYFLSASGSIDVRKQMTIVQCSEQKFAMEIAEVQLRACKERINTLRTQISIGQSVSAALRQQFSAEAVGQHT